jgi:hypothetical protein
MRRQAVKAVTGLLAARIPACPEREPRDDRAGQHRRTGRQGREESFWATLTRSGKSFRAPSCGHSVIGLPRIGRDQRHEVSSLFARQRLALRKCSASKAGCS